MSGPNGPVEIVDYAEDAEVEVELPENETNPTTGSKIKSSTKGKDNAEKKGKRVVIKTVDNRKIKIRKRLLASESLYFRNMFAGQFPLPDDAPLSVPFTKAQMEACFHCVEGLHSEAQPLPDMATVVNTVSVASFLQMENVCERLSQHIVQCANNYELMAAFRTATSSYPPLARLLWPLVIKRFRMIVQNAEFLALTDAEMETALKDDRLNINAPEEKQTIADWLRKHTVNNQRVTALQTQLKTLKVHGMPESKVVRELRKPRSTVVAIGGVEQSGLVHGVVESFYERKNEWLTSTTIRPHPVSFHGTAVVGGRMYLFGGFNSIEYMATCSSMSLKNGEWTTYSNMHEQRSYVASTQYTDSSGRHYAIALGGFTGLERLRSGELFSVENESWSLLPDMEHKRSDFSCTTIADRLVAVGGFDGKLIHSHCEMFDFGAQKWMKLPSMEKGRSGSTTVTYDRNVAVVIGGHSGSRRLKSGEYYDIREGIWHMLPSMDRPRSNFGAAIVDEFVYAAGGFSGRETTAKCEKLDLRNNKWQELASMSTAKSALRLVAFEDCEIIDQLLPYKAEEGYQRVEHPPY